MSRVLCSAALLAVLALAPPASAHGIVSKDGSTLRYSAPDPGIGARLTVTSPRPGTVQFSDSRAPGGIDWGRAFRSRSERRSARLVG